LSYNFNVLECNLITLQKIALLLSIKVIHTTKLSVTHSNDPNDLKSIILMIMMVNCYYI